MGCGIVRAILGAGQDGGWVECPAYAGLLLVPGIGTCLAPLHQLGQEGQHLMRIPQRVACICGLHLQASEFQGNPADTSDLVSPQIPAGARK